jgi:hypothetical protein
MGTQPKGARASPELGDLLRLNGERHAETHRVSSVQRKVIRDLSQCRTAALGGHLEACDRCGHRRPVYHSCRNRHCPKCQSLAQADWLEARRADLLPVEYFHVVFTLPHQLCPLALYRPRVVYDLLFRAATATLATFARDPRHFSENTQGNAADKTPNKTGGTLGITAILHTWAQNLSLHPHLHCVVTGGGLSLDQKRFVTPRRKGFLFPVRALSKVFRAKCLEGLRRAFEAGKLGDNTSVPMLCDTLRHRDWVVYAKPPFAGPESVLGYLGAYTHRIAISNARIRSIEHGRVTFRVRDSANAKRKNVMQLDEHEFIRRFLLHVLPKGFVRIRHYGLLANRTRKQKIARCRDLLAASKPEEPPKQTRHEKLLELTGFDIGQCPACREGRMGLVEQIDPNRRFLDCPRRVEIKDSS